MASIINADDGVISGAAGIKLSADTSGDLNIQTNGVTAISVSASQVVSFPATTGFSIASATVTNLVATSLTVSSGSTLNGGVVINELGADADTRIEGDTDANLFFVDASTDRIGVGTNAPGTKLEVSGVGTFTTGTQVTAGGTGLTFAASRLMRQMESTSTAREYICGPDTSTYGTYEFYTAKSNGSPTLAYSVNASGNVGIGTAIPANKLVVSTSTEADSVVFNNSSSGVNASNKFGFIVSEGGTEKIYLRYRRDGSGVAELINTSDAPFVFGTNNTERARITAGGDLLVGTTSFTNAANKGLAVRFSSATNSGGEGGAEIRNTSSSTDSDVNPPLIIYKGSVTTSSNQRFIQFYADDGGQPMGGIVGNGATNVQFVSLSDARQKTNIQSISGSLEKILALNPVSFDWIKNGEHVNAGFVAQNVEQVFPEFVVENFDTENGEPRKGLTGGMTGGIVAHLVKAIQEQQAMIEELKAKVAALEVK